MIAEIDYGATEPRDFQLLDNGAAFNGSGYNVALELLQIGGLIWASSTAYVAGELVRPTVGNGHLYQCTVSGTTGTIEPVWPLTSGTPAGTVIDGTVTWQEITPTVDWQTQSAGIVRVSGLDVLPRDTSYRVRYLVTDGTGKTGPFPNKNRTDVWRVGAVMAG
jgi:hypothetical protein